MTKNSDELRQAVVDALAVTERCYMDAQSLEDMADAAIAAYEAHRPRIAAPEGCQCGYDDQCAFAARAENAEARADAAWIAGRDAAVSYAVTRYRGHLTFETLLDELRALNPPETQP